MERKLNSGIKNLQQKILQLRSIYAQRGIPEEWLYDILKDIHIWSINSLRHGGPYAVPDCNTAWFDQIFSGELLRIGRLQYCRTQFGGRIAVFRKGEDIAIMAEDALTFDRQGLRSENGWQSVLKCEDGFWQGNLICNGKAEPGLTGLNADEWQPVLRYGDPVIAIHIPEDGPLKIEDCRASLEAAVQWFGKNCQDWKGFSCQAWLLNPVFQDMLPENSNIVQFQRLGNLYPMITESDVLNRLYPGKLRDHVVSAQSKGQIFRSGGMFILKNELINKTGRE